MKYNMTLDTNSKDNIILACIAIPYFFVKYMRAAMLLPVSFVVVKVVTFIHTADVVAWR